jgi:hypothetical protein
MNNWAGTTRIFTGALLKIPRVTFGLALRATIRYWVAFFLRAPLILSPDELTLYLPQPPHKETQHQEDGTGE